MTTQKQHWTKNEFLTYFLLYAAHADIFFKEEEKKHILSKIKPDTFEKVLEEFSKDNGYVRIQKIIIYHQLNQYFTAENILKECKELFLSDNHFHLIEQYTLSNMKRLLD